jgi:mycothiol synthase
MAITLHPYTEDDSKTWRTLVSDPTLAPHFDMLQGPSALEAKLQDTHLRRSRCALARLDGEPAGFCLTLVFPHPRGSWSALRLGVVEAHRRRGVGSALLAATLDGLAQDGAGSDVALSGWLPNPEAAAFTAHHGFRHDRFFWKMERTSPATPEVGWPAGVEARRFDASDQAFEDWNDVYNRSFADHYRFVLTTVADCRAVLARPVQVPDGVMLVYRDDVCVGFCRTSRDRESGEVAILGVTPEARGVGLGRALLRWGVSSLLEAGAPRVTLMVDGENETALSLYRSEGFDIARKREIWVRRSS